METWTRIIAGVVVVVVETISILLLSILLFLGPGCWTMETWDRIIADQSPKIVRERLWLKIINDLPKRISQKLSHVGFSFQSQLLSGMTFETSKTVKCLLKNQEIFILIPCDVVVSIFSIFIFNNWLRLPPTHSNEVAGVSDLMQQRLCASPS